MCFDKMEQSYESTNNTTTSASIEQLTLIIVEGSCGCIGAILILVTLIHLIVFDKLKTTYLLVQSQVCTYLLI